MGDDASVESGGGGGLGDKLRGLVNKGAAIAGAKEGGSMKQPLLNEAFSVDVAEEDGGDGDAAAAARESGDDFEEPSPYASIIRERYLRQQAAERAKEEAAGTTTNIEDPASGNANRERAESTPESLDIDIEGSTGGGGGRPRDGEEEWNDDDDDEQAERAADPNRYSLALSPSTSLPMRLIIPLLIVLAHGLFVYGQLAPMWRLRLFAHIDAWANATQPLARRTAQALGLPMANHLAYDHDGDVETFTYGFAVKRLWAAKGMPSTFGPRLSAVLLVLFSGAWPHVKLLLLHLNFWVPRRAKARTGALYWLSGFGKWSLADVLVVCVMIAIVHLDWDVDPAAIRDGVGRDLDLLVNIAKKVWTPMTACEKLLNEACSQERFESPKCWTCIRATSIMMDHPDWAQGAGQDILRGFETSGGGQASLRIAGMPGIYVFCAAATLSLLIGVAVDWLDHRARHGHADAAAPIETVTFDTSDVDEAPENTSGPSSSAAEASSARRRSQRARAAHALPSPSDSKMHLLNRVPFGSPFSSEHSYTLLFFTSLFAAFVVLLAATQSTMEREVLGAAPRLLEEVLGIQWHSRFSLRTLTAVTGEAGGPDLLLMGTFALFILVGPILRAALCVIILAIPLSEASHERLTYAINVLGAFCAWDVLGVAAFMVMLEMPAITDTIFVRPECALVPGSGDSTSCLEVQFNLLPPFFWLVLLGGGLLLVVSVATVRMGMRATDPFGDGDHGGPYLCGCFRWGGCCRPGTRSKGTRCCRRKRRRAALQGSGDAGAHGYSRLGGGEDGRNVV